MHLVADLDLYLKQNEYTHLYRVNDSILALFRTVEPGLNINAEFKMQIWQINYAWQNTLGVNKWTVLTPSWIHPQDIVSLAILSQAIGIINMQPHFLEELLFPNV
jgi:hypothetical protein